MPNQDSPNSALRDQLRSVFERAKLPTNPAIAAAVLNLVNDPASSSNQFANIIKNDPALSASLMKMCNSSYFTTRHPVTTIQRAVTVLGLRRIRMAAVSFQLVAHLDRLGKTSFDLKTFWQQSVIRACMAREVASHVVPELAEEAFLVGLLQECGILLVVQLLGEEYATLFSDGNLSPTAFYATERKQFKYNHVDVIQAMAEEWEFPDQIAIPLGLHHKIIRLAGNSDPVTRLSAVSYFVGSIRIGAGQCATDAEPQLLKYANHELNLNAEVLDDIFEAVGRAYLEVAELFSGVIPDDLQVTDLLMEANRQLSIAAKASDKHVQEVEAERDQFIHERKTLRNAVAQYREMAARDPLTGVLNRGALMESSLQQLLDADENENPVTVFFLDIDNFKSLNDDHGHKVGDLVLKQVASVITDSMRNGGIVGRYGGEEFVVFTTGLSDQESADHARQLVEAIASMDVSSLKLKKPVTCSLGALAGFTESTPEELFALADQLMYEAKRAGKNQAVFKPLGKIIDSKIDSDSLSMERLKEAGEAVVNDDVCNVDRLLDTAIRLNRNDTDEFLSARKQPRRQVVTPCDIKFFAGPSLVVRGENACIRNISAGGIGLVAGRALMRGDLIELCVCQSDGNLYTAGLVAFCRHLEDKMHEIGVQLISNDRKPIFSENPLQAIMRFNWVTRAVQDKYGDDLVHRRTA